MDNDVDMDDSSWARNMNPNETTQAPQEERGKATEAQEGKGTTLDQQNGEKHVEDQLLQPLPKNKEKT